MDRSMAGGSKSSGTFLRILGTALLLLGLSLGMAAYDTHMTGKGLYAAGRSFYLTHTDTWLYCEGGKWRYGDFTDYIDRQWNDLWITSRVGACIFDDAIYAFFITEDNRQRHLLQYVTMHTSGHSSTEPKTIVTGMTNHGVSAAVLRDVLYIFTISGALTSVDGQNFKATTLGHPPDAAEMVDAITFFPHGGGAPKIMLVYLDSDNNLKSTLFDGTSFSSTKTLPYPYQDQYPFSTGNLVLGTADGRYGDAGAKALCIQLYGATKVISDMYNHRGFICRWEYNLESGAWTANDFTYQGTGHYYLAAAPWFETVDSAGTMQLLHIIKGITYTNQYNGWIGSDYIIPQHNDPTFGWDGVPTQTSDATGDDDRSKKLRNLWSLVGVVLGPPPFAMNGADDASGLCDVQYGIDHTHSVTTTHSSSSTLSVGTETSIEGGLGEAHLDFSYAHGWTSSHGTTDTVEVATYYDFGPMNESPGDQGVHGWAIFNAPILLTQLFKTYAYDKQIYLGQDMYTTSTGGVVQQTAYFKLNDPGDSSIPHLFDGMPLYPKSTDLAHWLHIKDWNKGGSDWTVKFGDQSSPAVGTLNQGVSTTQEYTQTHSTVDSHGNSNSFGVEAGASFDIFEGFSQGITVGYETEFETETEVETTVTNSVSCSLEMPIPPHTNGYVENLLVQPYWLQAKTNKAPWIPTGYNGDLPWCLTWDVLRYDVIGGGTAGVAPDPSSASGTVRRGKGKGDKYKVEFGYLLWVDDQGWTTPLEMTADEFIKALGAEVALNGHVFPADGSKGKWTRNGNVWKYKTKEGVKKDPFVLKLDFGNGQWYFKTTSKHLEEIIPIADGQMQVLLDLQGTHRFAHWLNHHVDATWFHKENKATWDAYGIHKVKGEWNSLTGVGTTTLKGHLPKDVESWGDMEIHINGGCVTLPLLTLDGFLDTLFVGGALQYLEEGLTFDMDFGKGKWKLTLEGNAFDGEMAPEGGEVRVQVFVGGGLVSDQTLQLKEHAALLDLVD